MTEQGTQWAGIKTPDRDYNIRQVDRSTAVDMYWGKDTSGCCLFLINVHGDLTGQFRRERVSVQGIDTDLRSSESVGKQLLVIRLERAIDIDLFDAFCSTLLETISTIDNSSKLMSLVFQHLKRWKAFLAGGALRILSPEEQRGLFSELKFLQRLMDILPSEYSCIEAWLGPEGHQQDFVYLNRAVEIKSIHGNTRNSVRVSSEDQMETTCQELYLCVYRLEEQVSSGDAQSLNSLVREMYGKLSDAQSLELFSKKLAAADYVELPNYDSPTLSVAGITPYRVIEDFPRIVRSSLPAAILRVSYDLHLPQIKDYECGEDALWRLTNE